MRPITRFLINRRDNAADTWLASLHTGQLTRHRRRILSLWDTLLDAWTSSGTRRT